MGYSSHTHQTPASSIHIVAPAETATEQWSQRTLPSSQKRSNLAFPALKEPESKQVIKPLEADASDDVVCQSQMEFEADPAHEFWKWSVHKQNWYHFDESTGSILWAPLQLD
ncbi:uncharacterized protein CTRU02_204546 [Colletotrichum truncatum]|uniref:Uncharacterized protein n=1 Tax=Colletotrichum truncatum TaxID=5467 RepID=A0ACC3ZCC6_COLTU|nr:uncharacterized protein CTRU02_02775 [Colletotrichum truncatum]KAF6797733.1 hypothetical protein CTRU02_02775 [Colletotrichum truncatum]